MNPRIPQDQENFWSSFNASGLILLAILSSRRTQRFSWIPWHFNNKSYTKLYWDWSLHGCLDYGLSSKLTASISPVLGRWYPKTPIYLLSRQEFQGGRVISVGNDDPGTSGGGVDSGTSTRWEDSGTSWDPITSAGLSWETGEELSS